MAQFNLLSVCIKDKPMILSSVYEFLRIEEWIESYHYKSYEKVPNELKDLIYQQLEEKSAKATTNNKSAEGPNDLEVRRKLCHSRGNLVFEKKEKYQEDFNWSIEVEFDQSILLWHIATDICYYSDFSEVPSVDPKDKMGKLLSDYILYLLVMRPFMLPAGIGQIRFRDTCAETKTFIHERRRFISTKPEACDRLIDVSTDIPPIQVKGDRSKSVLFDACKLAKLLRKMEKEEKWGLINQFWVDILCYAANQCKGNYHAQQLGRGGELLTHVWLLMAHLGITEQFQISQGHMRAKLDVK